MSSRAYRVAGGPWRSSRQQGEGPPRGRSAGTLGREGLEVGDRVAHQPVDRGVGRAGDAQLLRGHVDELPGTAGGGGGRRAGAPGQEHDAHPGHGQRATEVPPHPVAVPTSRNVGLSWTVIACPSMPPRPVQPGGIDQRGRTVTAHRWPARAHGTVPTSIRRSAALPIPARARHSSAHPVDKEVDEPPDQSARYRHAPGDLAIQRRLGVLGADLGPGHRHMPDDSDARAVASE